MTEKKRNYKAGPGRPPGLKNRRTLLLESLDSMEGIEILGKKIYEAAIAGDLRAAEIIFDRCWPKAKPVARPVTFCLEADNLSASAFKVLKAVSAGLLSPDVGNQLLGAISNTARTLEIAELEKRLEALENGTENKFTEVA